MCRGCDLLKVDGETQVRKCQGSASSWLYGREETREHITIVYLGACGWIDSFLRDIDTSRG
jgi:hypothetical protein